MTETASPVTIEEYLVSMEEWINRAVSRTVRRGHPLFSHLDLLQEARLVLWKVYQRYADQVPAGELRRIGTRAVLYHTINLYRASQAWGQDHVQVLHYGGIVGTHGSTYWPGETSVTPLDRAEIREVVERVADDDVRMAVLMRTDAQPSTLPSEEARRIFRRARQKVRQTLKENGYSNQRGKSL